MRRSSSASPSGSRTSRAISATRRRTSAWVRRSGTPKRPCTTSRSRRSCSGGSSRAWRTQDRRATRASSWRSRSAATRHPPARWRTNCTSTSTNRSCCGSTITSARWASRRSSTCASRTRSSSRSGTATSSQACRSRWPRTSVSRIAGTSTIRSAPSATSSSTTSCRSSPWRSWRRPREAIPRPSRPLSSPRSGRSTRPIPLTTCAASMTATAPSTACRPTPRRETYCALRLEVENWRWSGVPFFIRTGKRMPITQTELRLVFRQPPRLGFANIDRHPESNQVVIKLDPTTGVRLKLDAHRGDAARRGRDHVRRRIRCAGR